jgi:predicted Zn finger-like uncharacterized protein
MIIKCPQCSATYDVPSAAAVQGRKVRCTRCAHVWRAEVIEGEVSAAPQSGAVPASPPAGNPAPQAAPVPAPAAQEPRTIAPPMRQEMQPAMSAERGQDGPAAPARSAPPQQADNGAPPPNLAAARPMGGTDRGHELGAGRAQAASPDFNRMPDFVPATERRTDTSLAAGPASAGTMAAGMSSGSNGFNGGGQPAQSDMRSEMRAPAFAPVPVAAPAHDISPPRRNDREPQRAPAVRAAGANSATQGRGRDEAWDQVEDSIGRVTGAPRQERPELAPPKDAMNGAGPRLDDQRGTGRTQGGRAVARPAAPTRPNLDDEGFWREKAPQPAAAWPDEIARTDATAHDDQELDGGDRPRRGGGALVLVGWLGLAGVIAGLLSLLYFARTEVVRALPGLAPVYAAAGLPVNVRGLEFRDISYKWGIDRKGRTRLTIAGKVINVSAEPRRVPSVAFVFLDAAEEELFNWATAIRDAPLAPGKTTSFEASVPAPPEAVANLQVRFAKTRN